MPTTAISTESYPVEVAVARQAGSWNRFGVTVLYSAHSTVITALLLVEPSMRSIHLNKTIGTIAAAAAMYAAPAIARAQVAMNDPAARDGSEYSDDSHASYKFSSASDRLSWARARALAANSTGFRIVVSLQDRHLWAIIGKDTVLSAPAAVAKGTTLEYGHSEWRFTTPRGMRTVLSKEADPIWQPPEWLYAETALEHGLRVGHLYAGRPVKLDDGRILTMRDGYAGVIQGGEFGALPTDEHIVFDNVLYVPPMGSKNRRVEGELGKYRLNLGDGYLLHGTPYKESIGMAATHGCVRLRDEDIEWLYDHVPVGTKVYIY
jgi:hypothetical protein